MSIEASISASLRLAKSVEALAAHGAELSLRQYGQGASSQIRALLPDARTAVDPRLFDGVDAAEEQAAVGIIKTISRQALDLLEKSGAQAGLDSSRSHDPPIAGRGLAACRVRSSGWWVSMDRGEVEEWLAGDGFDRIEIYYPVPPILFVIGRRPGGRGLSQQCRLVSGARQ